MTVLVPRFLAGFVAAGRGVAEQQVAQRAVQLAVGARRFVAPALLQRAAHQLAQLRSLFDAISRKRDVLDLLERAIDAQGVQIFIGGESGFSVFDDFSIITAPYQSGGQTVGVLGVIGPTRMAYDRMIQIVDITSRLVSNALSHNK